MPLDTLTVQDYRQFESPPKAGGVRKATSVDYALLEQSNHSRAYRIEFKGGGRTTTVFGKEFFRPQDISPHYLESRDPNKLFGWELRATKLITGKVGPLVPAIIGYSHEPPILLFDFVDGQSDRELLLRVRTDGDDSAKNDLVYRRARNIAIFDGRLQARSS